ncbi:PTS sugar transporter subunit IIA [Mesorhizobium sp. M1227]
MSRLDGIGLGIAIPHALLGTISSPVVSLTRLVQPVDFDGPYDDQSISFRLYSQGLLTSRLIARFEAFRLPREKAVFRASSEAPLQC